MNNDVFELVDMLYEMVTDAWAVPLGSEKCVIERDKVLDLLDEIKGQLPNEIEDAKKLMAARADYIASAKREADSIKQSADEQAKQLLAESSITLAAKQKAAEMLTSADIKSRELRRIANEYAEDTLKRTEEAINEALGEIRQSRSRFKAAVGPSSAVPPLDKK